MLTPVILSGGAGTRLWPLSRELYPKQLLPLVGKETMLQATALRVAGLDATAPIVVCNEAHRFLVAEQLRIDQCPGAGHPAGASAVAILRRPSHLRRWLPLQEGKADPLLLVLPADHVIRDVTGVPGRSAHRSACGGMLAGW